MNLIKLFETQSKLDARIVEEKSLQGRDMLPEKILALLVELGELANEWRGFKFWSNKQSPAIRPSNPIEHGNPMLEEYVDCLHFILSIGLELHPKIMHMEWSKYLNARVKDLVTKNEHVSITDMFNGLFRLVITFHDKQELTDYTRLIYLFFNLGRKLDFTLDDIETAYYTKNEINHSRQNNGY